MKNIDKFINELSENYKEYFSRDDIKNILEINSVIDDSPISPGKKLAIEYLSFTGKKDSGDIINFKKEFQKGVNIIIADNLRGKSTILKVIKASLTGDFKTIKADVEKWINSVVLGFCINDKHYTISIDRKARFKGSLYSISWRRFKSNNYRNVDIVFKEIDNKLYKHEIEKFFFNQFSYYSLKWTQKSSAKDKNELLEAGASWKTYYKTIYLESKDSSSFYGGQNQKLFQMLLGLENTYFINRLVVKRELLQFNISKQKDYQNSIFERNNYDKKYMMSRLDEIQIEIEKIDKENNIDNILELKIKYNDNLQCINENSRNILDLNEALKQLESELRRVERKIESNKLDKGRLLKEISKNKRLLIDLNEYIEVEQFFSDLEIKCCPSCDSKIDNTKKKIGVCPLCHEHVDKIESNKDNYIDKIKNIEELLNRLNKEVELIENQFKILIKELDELIVNRMGIQEKIKDLELKNIESDINTKNIYKKIKNIDVIDKYSDDKKNELIEERAILRYKIDNLFQDNKNDDNLKGEAELEVLSKTIEFLEIMRYEKSKNIINELKTIMLNEIHQFGLLSITDVNIDSKFNISYIQNGVPIKFDSISEGEQLRVKLAFYLSIIQMDIEKNIGRHTRFLVIDSPNKEEGDSRYLEGLKDILLNIDRRYKENLQIIIGTASRGLENILRHQSVYVEGEYLF